MDGQAESDLKYLAPLSVVDEEWPKPVQCPVKTKPNDNFSGTLTVEMESIDSDYYKYNQSKHFVWTNQLVVGKDVKVDNINCFKDYKGTNYIYYRSVGSCNLKNPDKSFMLKKVENFGYGLFAKHFIKEGWFLMAV